MRLEPTYLMALRSGRFYDWYKVGGAERNYKKNQGANRNTISVQVVQAIK